MKSLPFYFLFALIPFFLFAAAPINHEPIQPIPDAPALDKEMVNLGKLLFHDPRLSGNEQISCATCHPLDKGGVDGLKVSTGINGLQGNINAPTVYNSSLSFAQFWDGRAETLEEQAIGPIENPVEMGADWSQVILRLKQDSFYKKTFAELFSDGITQANIVRAIADFERTLVTPDGRFDLYLKGDQTAINKLEKKGYLLFKAYGCSSCHQGVAVGGNMYQKMGVSIDYFAERGNITKADLGRFNVTGLEYSKFEFKVPSLRNVALTAPYFHDATAPNLETAILIMGRYQIGKELPKKDIKAIAAFLRTLTGKDLE